VLVVFAATTGVAVTETLCAVAEPWQALLEGITEIVALLEPNNTVTKEPVPVTVAFEADQA